jgi:hypothetical protein
LTYPNPLSIYPVSGLIKDSTMTRPGVIAADPSKPLATEAHPNPSIPEAAEESAPKGKTFQTFRHFFVYRY